MKRLVIISTLISVLFVGCERREYLPIAEFAVDYTLIIPGEVVLFSNYSEYADYFEWNFGDGTISRSVNPSHYYTQEGIYDVVLAAYRNGNVDYAYITIEVYETTLEVEVRDYDTDDLITGIDVTLYTSLYGWENFTNPVISAPTDANGIVIFKGLDAISYYLDVYSTYFTNEYLGYSDIDFIQTAPLQYAHHNKFIAFVRYHPPVASSGTTKSTDGSQRVRNPALKEIKKVYKDRLEQTMKNK